MKIYDEDKGLRGFIIHHKPLTILQLKRLLLLFDEINFTNPKGENVFLEEGSVCYRYSKINGGLALLNLDGFDLLRRYQHLKVPSGGDKFLPFAKMLHYGQDSPAIIPIDILPYYKSKEEESKELKLLDRFEKAIDKKIIKILDYKNSSFYHRNGIHLKIAFDHDATDSRSLDYLKKLLSKESVGKPQTKVLPYSPLINLAGVDWFPNLTFDRSIFNQEEILYDYEDQFFSIVGKVNKKLALANHFGLTPIFIDENIFNFYQYKVTKARKTKDEKFRQEWAMTNKNQLNNLINLLFNSSFQFIPDEALNKISILEIISYKERCLSDLYALRRSMFTDFEDLLKMGPSVEAYSEIQKIIEKKIIPQIQNYQSSQNEILFKVLKKSISYGAVLFSAGYSFVPGLSPLFISLLSGLTPLLAEDALQLSQKYKEEKKREYESTFSYFLNLNHR